MKRALKILGAIILFLLFICLGIYFLQYQIIKKSFIKFYGLENIKEEEKPYTFIKCNSDIFKPKFAYITGKNMALISFYTPKHLFSQTNEEWENSYTGGTTVKNTTFDELVKMVKEDCGQFQEGHGDYYGDDIAWSYSPSLPKPEKTEEDIYYERNEKIMYDLLQEINEKDNEESESKYDSLEEAMRAEGFSEEQIMRTTEKNNLPYKGPGK